MTISNNIPCPNCKILDFKIEPVNTEGYDIICNHCNKTYIKIRNVTSVQLAI